MSGREIHILLNALFVAAGLLALGKIVWTQSFDSTSAPAASATPPKFHSPDPAPEDGHSWCWAAGRTGWFRAVECVEDGDVTITCGVVGDAVSSDDCPSQTITSQTITIE